ncbi:neuropeptide Y receptor type 2-like [Montipora foliosa]|uniref:neuropeptide Y receptor type 2-like n=1 Tax=Montipora foliosa TaxID=591990 RepID=UPI0035F18728
MNNTNENISTHHSLDREELQDSHLTAWKIIQVLAYYFMIVLSVIGNTVVIRAIKKTGKRARRQTHYLFILNLSVADLLLAVENIPMTCTHLLLNGAWKIEGPFGNFLCKFDAFLSIIFILISNLTILAIAVEKFCGVFFPLRELVSSKRALVVLTFAWLISGCYASPLFFFATLQKHPDAETFRCLVCTGNCAQVYQWYVLQTVLLATGFILTLVLYVAIGVKIWLRRMPGIYLPEAQRKEQAKRYRAIKMLAMLIVVFYTSFIPFWVSQLAFHFHFEDKLGSDDLYAQISAFFMFCNGAINPVIYSKYNLQIRYEFKSFLCCGWKPEVNCPTCHIRKDPNRHLQRPVKPKSRKSDQRCSKKAELIISRDSRLAEMENSML